VRKGAVRINLGGTDARTILPDASDIPAVTDLFFTVAFTPDSGTVPNTAVAVTYPPTGALAYSSFNNVPFILNAGTYNILITAYKASDKTGGPIAGWSNEVLGVAPIAVSSSVINVGTSLAPINLMVFSTLGNGSFQYSITFAALPTPLHTTLDNYTHTLDIKDSTGSSLATYPKSLTNVGTANTATVSSLPAGYYTVIVTLAADNCQNRVLKNVMHIYPGLTSKYINNSIPAPNQNKFSVYFDLNGINANGTGNLYLVDDTSNSGEDYTGLDEQGDFLNASTQLKDPGTPANDGYDFLGWFDNVGGTGDAWVFGTSKIFRDLTLFAKWEPNVGAKFYISFISDDQNISSQVNIISGGGQASDPVSYADILAGRKTITITLAGSGLSAITWELEGVPISGATSQTLTINSSSAFLSDLVDGEHDFTVNYTQGGQKFDSPITILMNNF